MKYKETSTDFLRRTVAWLNNTREDALDGLTIEQLIKLKRTHDKSEWDWTIDQLNDRQLKMALKGKDPGVPITGY
jgi:hypothetical protein